jgi:GST-like protein
MTRRVPGGDEYPNVQRWAEEIAQRPAVQRGTRVNRTWGDDSQVPERHALRTWIDG